MINETDITPIFQFLRVMRATQSRETTSSLIILCRQYPEPYRGYTLARHDPRAPPKATVVVIHELAKPRWDQSTCTATVNENYSITFDLTSNGSVWSKRTIHNIFDSLIVATKAGGWRDAVSVRVFTNAATSRLHPPAAGVASRCGRLLTPAEALQYTCFRVFFLIS